MNSEGKKLCLIQTWQKFMGMRPVSYTHLIMMHQGKAIIDKAGADKKAMQVDDILGTFNEISIECGN